MLVVLLAPAQRRLVRGYHEDVEEVKFDVPFVDRGYGDRNAPDPDGTSAAQSEAVC